MADETVQTTEAQPDSFSDAISRSELDQHSDETSAATKATLPQHRSEEQASKPHELLDAIAQDAPMVAENQEAIDALKEARDKIATEEKAEAEAALPGKLAGFDPEAVAAVMEKYSLTEEDLATDPRWADLVANELSEQSEAEAAATQAKTEAANSEQAATEQQRYESHFAQLAKLANDPSVNDPKMVAAFEANLGEIFGANTPEAAQNITNLSGTLVQGGISLMSSVVPHIVAQHLGPILESMLPGFSEQYFHGRESQIWNETVKAGEHQLPPYDSEEWKDATDKAVKANPWLMTIGDKLPHWEGVQLRAQALARVLSGERISAREAEKLIESGRSQATKATRKVSVSKALGAGRSRGQFSAAKDDSFKSAIVDYMAAQKSGGR